VVAAQRKFGWEYFAQADPGAPAVLERRGRVWSRNQLFEAANRISRGLRAAGLREGDCLAIFAPNCVEYLAVYLAATQTGLYVVLINPHLANAEAAYILEDSGARALFAHTRLAALVRATLAKAGTAPEVRLSCGELEGFVPLETFCESHSGLPLEAPVTGRLLTYTSATTGRPKGVELPLQDAQRSLERVIAAHNTNGIRLEDGNVHLCASMLYHPAPLEWSVLALHMGHQVVLVDHWEPELLLQLIEKHAVTTTFMVPAMFIRMLKLPAGVRLRYSTKSLRFVAHGAAPCPIEIKHQMIDWLGPVIWEAYGSSEGSGTIVSAEDWLERPGTVGRPFPGSRVAILNDSGEEVQPGVIGTIYLTRYTGDRFQYRGDPEKTRSAYRGDLFTVGDVGYVDAEGYLFLCDRKIDMVICGGMNIYPAEVESIMVQHPQVADCAVFGVPDELMGEALKAVVELQPGVPGNATLTQSLLDFLGKHLSPAKLPRRIEYVAQLPRDPNGKIYKRSLRNAHWEALRRQI
jgi:long-chain acyl-CoA synthetase